MFFSTVDGNLTSTMTVLLHGPPTRGPVMHFCESEARGGQRGKKHKCRSARGSRVPCSRASRQELLCTPAVYATCYVTGPASANHSLVLKKRAAPTETPLDQSEPCSTEACTQRHMARLRQPCEREVEHCCCVKCKCSADTPNPD